MKHSLRIRSVLLGGLFAALVLVGSSAGADEFASAKSHGSGGCPAGAFLDIGRGECWSCPKDYGRTVLFPVDHPRACERSALFKPAEKHARGTGLLKTDCPRGQFWDPNGYCYSCPSDYNRTADPVTSPRACARSTAPAFARATQGKKAGCPAGTFLDIGRGDCWSCPANWYRTVNPVTGAKACTSKAGNILAIDSTATCTLVLTALGEGEKGAARFMADVEKVIAPVMHPVNDGMRKLNEQLSAPAELDKLIKKLATGLRLHPEVVAEAQRLSDPMKKNSRQVKSLLLDPKVMCEGIPAERNRRLSGLGLRPNLPLRQSGLLKDLFVGNAYAATKQPYLAVSFTVSFTVPTSPPIPFNLGGVLVTNFRDHNAFFFTPGPFITLPPKTPIIGAALGLYLFPSADISDFEGFGTLSAELSFGPGEPLKEFLKAAGVKLVPDSVNLSFDPRVLLADAQTAQQLLLSLGYGVSFGLDKNFKEIPRVVEVGGSIDISFKLGGF